MNFYILLFLIQLPIISKSQFLREKVVTEEPIDFSTAKLGTPELLEKNGIKCEVHHVQTGDGYILELHRIPSENNNSQVLVLFHGGLASTREWFLPISGTMKDSFGYMLSQLGKYDIWMANSRGNGYSNQHISLKPESKKFWDFTIDEQAYYDFPAQINYILKTTNQTKLSAMGISLGGMITFRSLSIFPELNDKIKIFVGWGTNGGYLGKMKSSLTRLMTTLAQPEEPFKSLLYRVTPNGQLPPDFAIKMLQTIYPRICKNNFPAFCDKMINSVGGKTSDIWPDDVVEWTIMRFPAPFSVQTLVHLAQGVKFAENRPSAYYDFGIEKNLEIYKTEIAPIYNMSKVTTPCAFFSGESDGLVSPKDVDYFATFLPNFLSHTVVGVNGSFSHGDFIISKWARELVYQPTIDLINSYN